MADDNLYSSVYRRFNASELPALLAEVDEQMEDAGCDPVHLVAVGGASMLSRIPGRYTGDIDIVSEGLNPEVREASRIVAEHHNLAPDWINDGVKGFSVAIELLDPERIFTGKRLMLDSAGPLYLLAMKLLSGREVDADDCVHLIREAGIYDEDKLLDLMQSSTTRQLRPRDDYWAKEMLSRARKGYRTRMAMGWVSALIRSRQRPRVSDQHGSPPSSEAISGAGTSQLCGRIMPITKRLCSRPLGHSGACR